MPFINKYKWEGINFSSEKGDRKKFEKNNLTIALNVLSSKKQKMYPAYVSRNNSNRKNQVIFLMIPNGKGLEAKSKGWWNYLTVKKLSALLRGITSKYYVDFYCLNCLHSFRTKTKLESHNKVCENKDFCNVIMPFEDTKKLEFKQYQKSDKASLIIYADLQCMTEKIDGCKNNPENLSTTKRSEHIPSGFSMSTISWFRSIKISMMYTEVKIVKKSCKK